MARQSVARLIHRAASAVAAAVFATGACAQPAAGSLDWPKGPITLVVPFSPGGGGDTIVRTFAAPLAAALRSTVVVENRPGAGGNVGTASVARAPADGNTVVFGTMGTMGTNHALYKKTGYSIDDFEPVALLGSTALALVVGPNAPVRTVKDLVAQAHRRPGELSCASGGNGTVSHLACALLQQVAGIEVNHVPYKSSSAAYVDLMVDRVSFMIDVMPPLAPHIAGGRLRAVAVSTTQRLPALPDTPTMAETISGYEIVSWDGLFAPRGTPVDRLDRLHDAVGMTLTNAELVNSMRSRGYMAAAMPRKDFADFVRKEHVRMVGVVRKMGISLD